MKKIMKKALSLMLALVMVFSLAPMTANAATGTGTDSDPFVLTSMNGSVINDTIEVAAGTTAYVTCSNLSGGMMGAEFDLTITGSTGFAVKANQNGGVISSNDTDGTVKTTIFVAGMRAYPNAGTGSFEITNASSEKVTYTVKVALPAGTMNNPEIVELAEGRQPGSIGAFVNASIKEGADMYWFTCTAPDDGAISVNVSAMDDEYNDLGWTYQLMNNSESVQNDQHRSNDDEVMPSDSVKVKKDDQVILIVNTYNPTGMNPAGTVYVSFGFEGVGSANCPDTVETGNHSITLAEGTEGYYYEYIAEKAGKVTVAMDTENNANGWQYQVNVISGTAITAGDLHDNATTPVVASETVDVAVGDKVKIMVNTFDAATWWATPAGTVDWSLSFVEDTTGGDTPGGEEDNEPAGTIDDPADLLMGTNIAEVESGFYYYEWTATGKGTLTIYGNELQSPDGYAYFVFVNDEQVASVSSTNASQEATKVYVNKDDVVMVKVYRPDLSSGDVAIEAKFANYAISDTVLSVKENTVALDQNHDYTVFVFKVAEDGNYTISTTGTVIGNWGSFDWNLNNPNATKNTMTVNLEKDQTFYYGVPSDKAECTITIVRNGDIEDDGPTYTPYANKVTPEAYTFESTEENLIYINVKDNVEDAIVLGEDGFYHYGTENGPVVLVDLANETLSFAAMVGSGIGEDVGTTPARDPYTMVDYTSAIQAYVANTDKETKLYPLTEDLITFFKVYGESQGWYGTKLGFNLFGDDAVDPEKYWMFACCYVYEVVEGDGGKWTQGSTDGLTIKANGEFDEFIRLEVDGKEVDKANYTVKEGSTIVTLNKDYLATLSVGEHTVTFVYENNGFEYTADATITIATPVGSGDATNIALWIAVLGLGVVAIAGSVVMRKREF